MGGIGKTALAVRVAHRLTDHFPDAQIVVDLAGTTDRPLAPAEAMRRVVHAFRPELRLPDDPAELAAVYRTTLAGRRVLLLFDDAAGGAQVRPLLPPAPCGLIVTSRRAIALSGMRSFNLDLLSEDEARALLREILGGERATPEELDEIAQLCGRLPLALRVAGSFLKVHADWTPAEYTQALADERERLARLVHEDLDVRTALILSAAQLVRERAELAAAWQVLSVFPAPFDRAAAAAVWEVEEPEARDRLSELTVRGLLLYDAEGRVYRLHDLMRPVARDVFAHGGAGREAAAEGERLGRAALRHAGHYLALGDQADDLYKQGGEHVLEGLRRFDAAWPHLQAAFARMQARDDDPAARWLSEFANSTGCLLLLRLSPGERIPILEAALCAACRLADRRDEGVHLGNLGSAYRELGELQRATQYYEQSLAIAREIRDRCGEAVVLSGLGSGYVALGEVQQAIGYYKEALEIDREIADPRGQGADLVNLGAAYALLEDVERATKYYNHALEATVQTGDRRLQGSIFGNLGAVYFELRDAPRAIEYYEQALEIARQIGYRQLEANTLANLGLLARDQGDAARDLWQQALRIFEAIEDPSAGRVRGWLAGL